MGQITISKPMQDFCRIYALDPGGTTGYAKLWINKGCKEIYIAELGEFPTWQELENEIAKKAGSPIWVVVYEGFTIRTLAAHLIPVEVIGIIRFLCLKYNVHHFKQEPHERKACEKWYGEELDKFPSHYGSALRHGICFAVKNLCNNERWSLKYDFNQLMQNRMLR